MNCQRCQDLNDICRHLLAMEREREKEPPGSDSFSAALDELEEYLVTGKSHSLDARRGKKEYPWYVRHPYLVGLMFGLFLMSGVIWAISPLWGW